MLLWCRPASTKNNRKPSCLHRRAASAETFSAAAPFLCLPVCPAPADFLYSFPLGLKNYNRKIFPLIKTRQNGILSLYLKSAAFILRNKEENYHDDKQKWMYCLYCKQLCLSCPEGELLHAQQNSGGNPRDESDEGRVYRLPVLCKQSRKSFINLYKSERSKNGAVASMNRKS